MDSMVTERICFNNLEKSSLKPAAVSFPRIPIVFVNYVFVNIKCIYIGSGMSCYLRQTFLKRVQEMC